MQQSATAQAEAFYQKFKGTASSIEEQIDSLADTSNTQSQNRSEIIERCLSRITQLSHEIKDAMVFLPAYDQRNYSQRVKELSERLENVRASVAPKAKFSFKGGRKGLSARPTQEKSETLSSAGVEDTLMDSLSLEKQTENAASQAATVEAQRKTLVRLPVPQSAQGQSCVILNIQQCVVVPAQSSASLFSTMTVKQISESALDLGSINGPVHLTGLVDCTIVMACRQFRMHTCKNCKIYLWCTSRPIIEDCTSIFFAPLLASLLSSEILAASENKWDQVDDFNWLRSEPSPNWTVLQPVGRLTEEQFVHLRNTRDHEDVEEVVQRLVEKS